MFVTQSTALRWSAILTIIFATASLKQADASTVRCGDLEGDVCFWLLHPDEDNPLRSDLEWADAWRARSVDLDPGCYYLEAQIWGGESASSRQHVTWWAIFEDGSYDEIWTMAPIPDGQVSHRETFPLGVKAFDKRVRWLVVTHPAYYDPIGHSVWGAALSFVRE